MVTKRRLLLATIFIMLLMGLAEVIPSLSNTADLRTIGKAVGHGRLYVLSEISRPDGFDGSIGGRVTVLELATMQELYSVTTGVDVDASLSPDGSRLYIAGIDASANCEHGTHYLSALDARNGTEIWRIPINNRVSYHGGGPSTLSLSPDGRWLYFYSYPWCTLDKYKQGQVPFWLQTVDTTTGQVLPDTILLPDCGAPFFTTPAVGEVVLITCGGDIRLLNVRTRQFERFSGQPSSIAGSALLPDGRRLYVVTTHLEISVFDLEQRTIVQQLNMNRTESPTIDRELVALSADGSRLVVGHNIQEKPGTDTASELRMFDTRTWQEVHRWRQKPIAGSSLAISSDGRFVYAVSISFNGKPLPDADTILALSASSEQLDKTLVRKGEGIVRIFSKP